MKTMRAPKMDVIRFTESDVIVASGEFHEIVTLVRMGNDNFSDNAVMFGDGVELSFDGIQHGAYAHLINTSSSFYNGTSAKTLNQLISQTSNDDTTNGNFNGIYEYNNSTRRYEWYVNQ